MLPYFGKYVIRQELVLLEGETAKTHILRKVPLVDLAEWDAQHDVLGQLKITAAVSSKAGSEDERDEKTADGLDISRSGHI